MSVKGKPILQWLQIFLGLALCVVAYNSFLIPNEIAPGGFTGIGQLVSSLTGWPIGMIALALNIPVFLLSFRSLGMSFGARSIVATAGLSVLLDLVPLPVLTADPLLASIYGGVLAGVGFGLIMRGGATTGGSDMLGALIHKKLPWARISMIILMVDGLVIIASGFVFSMTAAMYALISAFFMSRLLDGVLEGIGAVKAYFIISSKSEEIAQRIMTEMDRGVTGLYGQGMYSSQDTKVLLCVVNRFETVKLRNIVSQTDAKAFMVATDVHEALGEGFKSYS